MQTKLIIDIPNGNTTEKTIKYFQELWRMSGSPESNLRVHLGSIVKLLYRVPGVAWYTAKQVASEVPHNSLTLKYTKFRKVV